MTFFRRMQLRYGMRWRTGYIDWRLVRDVIYALAFGALLAYVSAKVDEFQMAINEYDRLKQKLATSESHLLGCINGGYAGVYRFDTSGNKLGFKCDAKAWEM